MRIERSPHHVGRLKHSHCHAGRNKAVEPSKPLLVRGRMPGEVRRLRKGGRHYPQQT